MKTESQQKESVANMSRGEYALYAAKRIVASSVCWAAMGVGVVAGVEHSFTQDRHVDWALAAEIGVPVGALFGFLDAPIDLDARKPHSTD